MKKLTWLFLSMMLTLGMGTAFAQGDGGEPSIDVPRTPSITPASNSTVAVDSKITISGFGDYSIYYVIDGSDEDFNLTYEQLEGTNNLTLYNDETQVTATSVGTMTIKAAAVNIDNDEKVVAWSPIRTVQYTVVARPATPTFNPDGGEITETTQITLTNGTEGDDTPLKIYYAKKGLATVFDELKTVSSLNSAQSGMFQKVWLYEGPLTTDKDTTIHAATAMVVGEGNYATVIWSEPVTRRFTVEGSTPVEVELVAPTFTPDGGEVDAEQGITISTTTPGAKIYYGKGATASFVNFKTEDELEEAANNSDDMSMAVNAYFSSSKPSLAVWDITTPGESCSISAAAVLVAADGKLTWSNVTTRVFTVKDEEGPVEAVAQPVITPENDGTVYMGTKVTITCGTADAEIYYTTNGSTPYNQDKDGYPVSLKKGDTVFKYTEPFELTEDMLIKQITWHTNSKGDTIGKDSVYAIRIRAVAIKEGKLSMGRGAGYNVYPNNPTFSVTGKVMEGTKVAIECVPSQAVIFYTTDGSTPTFETGTLYTDSIEITENVTIKAIAVLGQYSSGAVAASYTIKGEEPVVEKDTLPMPKFSVEAGEVEKGTTVALSCDTADAKIYYSINADTVTVNSLEYTAEIAIDSAMTIRAIAVKEGLENSPVAVAAYTIKKEETGNESLELTGVSVCPNPSTGVFHIELPVAATVEVFASNGVLVRSFNAAAGNVTLSLDHSGIYFLRIAGEGRATVKRVIVK